MFATRNSIDVRIDLVADLRQSRCRFDFNRRDSLSMHSVAAATDTGPERYLAPRLNQRRSAPLMQDSDCLCPLFGGICGK